MLHDPYEIMDLINRTRQREFSFAGSYELEPPAADRVNFSTRELEWFWSFHVERESQLADRYYTTDHAVCMVLCHG